MRPIIVPTTDINSETAIVTAWNVPDRSLVEVGDIVAEVETSKSVLDVVAPEAGYLLRCAQEGEEIALVRPLAYLFPSPEALEEHAVLLAETVAEATSAAADGVRATVPARRRAAELGIDVASLTARGLVTVKMVEAAAGEQPAGPARELPHPSALRATWTGSWSSGQGSDRSRSSTSLPPTRRRNPSRSWMTTRTGGRRKWPEYPSWVDPSS